MAKSILVGDLEKHLIALDCSTSFEVVDKDTAQVYHISHNVFDAVKWLNDYRDCANLVLRVSSKLVKCYE